MNEKENKKPKFKKVGKAWINHSKMMGCDFISAVIEGKRYVLLQERQKTSKNSPDYIISIKEEYVNTPLGISQTTLSAKASARPPLKINDMGIAS